MFAETNPELLPRDCLFASNLSELSHEAVTSVDIFERMDQPSEQVIQRSVEGEVPVLITTDAEFIKPGYSSSLEQRKRNEREKRAGEFRWIFRELSLHHCETMHYLVAHI